MSEWVYELGDKLMLNIHSCTQPILEINVLFYFLSSGFGVDTPPSSTYFHSPFAFLFQTET